MDAKTQWKVSADVDSLVAAIVENKKQLITACVLKHGMKTRALTCDVYAGPKLLELLQLSELWTPCEDEPEDLTVLESRRQHRATERVADFTLFKLHRMDILREGAIRLVMTFHVDENSVDQTWYGDVEIVSP
jgi:hypothetical protein